MAYQTRLRARDETGEDTYEAWIDVGTGGRPSIGEVLVHADGTTRFRVTHVTLVHGKTSIYDVRRISGESPITTGSTRRFPKGQDIGPL